MEKYLEGEINPKTKCVFAMGEWHGPFESVLSKQNKDKKCYCAVISFGRIIANNAVYDIVFRRFESFKCEKIEPFCEDIKSADYGHCKAKVKDKKGNVRDVYLNIFGDATLNPTDIGKEGAMFQDCLIDIENLSDEAFCHKEFERLIDYKTCEVYASIIEEQSKTKSRKQKKELAALRKQIGDFIKAKKLKRSGIEYIPD